MTEDADLIAALDAIEVNKGPERSTCIFWRDASSSLRAAVLRNVASKGHTAVTALLRKGGHRVTAPGIKEHVAGACPKCQTS